MHDDPQTVPFRVKICGITSARDGQAAAASGADAIGLNFVAGSPRCLEPDAARTITAAVPEGVLRVGVFAGCPPDRIIEVADRVGLDAIQLHGPLAGDSDSPPTTAGGEPPQWCRELVPLPVIRAASLGPAGLEPCRRWIASAVEAGGAVVMVLVDAAVPRGTPLAERGGTGRRADWAALASEPPPGLPLGLAGGLTPENVAEAIEASGVGSVDTASGVERQPGIEPGIKDEALMRLFVERALAAFAAGKPGSARSG